MFQRNTHYLIEISPNIQMLDTILSINVIIAICEKSSLFLSEL